MVHCYYSPLRPYAITLRVGLDEYGYSLYVCIPPLFLACFTLDKIIY